VLDAVQCLLQPDALPSSAYEVTMKRLILVAVLLLPGCAGPAADYVRAEAAAWAEFDPYLDGWVEKDPALSSEKKDALHQLNVARRARVRHAIAQIESGS
jgi:uncharacterized lipoprotein YajG